MTKIINWKTQETIIEDPNLLMKELVEKAVKDKISLAYADLYGACLMGVNLEGADLEGADLRGADLFNACLFGVNLEIAMLRGADLRYIKINKNQMRDLLKALGVEII